MSAQTYTLINTIAPAAVQSCVNSGIFPSVVIGQAIWESDSGRSTLASKFNNLFGHIASSSWMGATAKLGGKLWRAYGSVIDSIKAHIEALKKPKYWLRGIGKAKTPFEQAQIIQDAGYNTGPDRKKYAANLSAIIRQYNLQQYDEQLFAIEKKTNSNNLAFRDQSGLTKFLHSITG
jgi:flagellum-specific peptidoglycan hydrolase FlgJ